MKNIFKSILLVIGIAFLVQSCEDWTMPEANVIQDLGGIPKSEQYYENLRAYKETDHQIAFGWFGFWNGGTSTSARGAMRSAPDSMDIISNWGAAYNLTQTMMDDMIYVQDVYGTKVTYTVFSHNMSNLFKETESPFENKAEHIPAAAKALSDSIAKYGYDGIDFDHECSRGDLFYDKDNMTTLLREMRKNLGPDKLILVDGHLDYITEEGWTYANYAIAQAYNTSSGARLQTRYDAISKFVEPGRFIVTENFEAHWKNGGSNYTDEDGNKMPSLLGMAKWHPNEGNKAGCGTYHMEYEYSHDPDYKFLRQAIQIMNPSAPNN